MLGPRLDLRQSQSLVMTPQLQQAIKLLQLSNIELAAFVEQELERNPLLERDEGEPALGEPEAATPEAAPAEPPDSTAYLTDDAPPVEAGAALDAGAADLHGGDDGSDLGLLEAGALPAYRDAGGGHDGDDDSGFEERAAAEVGLHDHLRAQALVEIADPAWRLIALHLIDLVDDAGYLPADLSEVADTLGADPALVERVVLALQRLEPTGVCARSLAECLSLQLAERDRLDPAMRALLDHLPLLGARDFAALERICGVDRADILDMLAEIRALDPKPGLRFGPAPAAAVTPDILMRAAPDGTWAIELNADTLPRVLVNRRYLARVGRSRMAREDKDYLSEQLQSANWLVKSLHQRATTILKVAAEIVRQQDGFFRYGVAHLRPLILRQIAEAIGMHESTVSRVTTNKFLATPRGLYELKYFFTSAISSASGGEAHSAEAVRWRIKALIDAEPAAATLSDDRLVEILRKDGVDIARRTVAKYREAMRIPSSVQRKRIKTAGA